MSRKFLAVLGVLIVMASVGFVATPAQATSVQWCADSDYSDGGKTIRATASRVYGWFTNCGPGGAGETWYVRIVVNNASDSPCVTIVPNKKALVDYDPTWWTAGVNHDAVWAFSLTSCRWV